MPNTVAATGQTLPTPEDDTVAGSSWTDRVAAAETLVPFIGRLFRSQGVVTAVYGRSLVNQQARTILKIHDSAACRNGARSGRTNSSGDRRRRHTGEAQSHRGGRSHG